MKREEIAGAVARGWCAPATENRVMDADLAMAITDEVVALLDHGGTRVFDTYTLQLLVPEDGVYYAADTHQVAAAIAEAEENLTDLLPAGYRARIRRWDHADEEETPEPEPAQHYHDWKPAYGSSGGPTVEYCECGEYQTIHTSGRITKGEPRL